MLIDLQDRNSYFLSSSQLFLEPDDEEQAAVFDAMVLLQSSSSDDGLTSGFAGGIITLGILLAEFFS